MSFRTTIIYIATNLVGIVQLLPGLVVHLLVLVHPLVNFLEQPGQCSACFFIIFNILVMAIIIIVMIIVQISKILLQMRLKFLDFRLHLHLHRLSLGLKVHLGVHHHHHHHHGLPAYSHHDKIPPWWEYVSNDKGGNVSVSKSHHT